jgi:hypothetical protein
MARPCTDNVKHGQLVYAHRSNNEGVGMIELIGLIGSVLIILTWLVFGGEGDE